MDQTAIQSITETCCRYLVDNQFYELHVCFASFVAQDVGDLSITAGDIIVACNQVNEHWSQGQVCYDAQANHWPKLVISQQVGTFPINHCWQMDSLQVKEFLLKRVKEFEVAQFVIDDNVQPEQPAAKPQHKALQQHIWSSFIPSSTHSSSLSSRSSSQHLSSDNQQPNNHQVQLNPPVRPSHLPKQSSAELNSQPTKPTMLAYKHQDKLKGWLHTVRKKTVRLSTRITASLGLISLTRDEEFEKHYESFKHLEKTIKAFIKNLQTFIEHFEHFLLALQSTTENLTDFYRDRSHQKELEELKKKNKVLTCEYFHEFRRTVDRQVIAVAGQLLQKFSGPHQMISKRSAKLLDFDSKTKELESCSDAKKKLALRDEHVIAKELYEKINRQLIDELPVFNQLCIDIFRECIIILLEGRRNLILSYTKQTANLLNTPLMSTYTASDVASHILMSCDAINEQNLQTNKITNYEEEPRDSGRTSGPETKASSGNDFLPSSQSISSHLSSEFEQIAIINREISSTPLPEAGDIRDLEEIARYDEPDAGNLEPSIIEGAFSENDKKPRFTDQTVNQNVLSVSCEQPKERRKKRKPQIYIASWPFEASGPNQLTVKCKQPLKLIKACDECGNSDWSLVQDKKGQLGYVPSSYIVKKEP